MLRDHELFRSPLAVDQTQATTVPTPSAWTPFSEETEIEVLSLVEDTNITYRDGWCTYTYEQIQAPELEIICGGINAKTPEASAIWRQGHLLHFGFEPSPAQLNDNGRALLINSISYIARFRDDRPIVRTPSVFYSNVRFVDRASINRLVKNESRDLHVFLEHYLTAKAFAETDGMTREEVGEWYRVNRGYLRANARGKFLIDEDARKFGMDTDDQQFFEQATAVDPQDTDRVKLAQKLLARYAPGGPGEDAELSAWKEWWTSNRDYLFFTDTGGFCWLIDPLAKSRRVPSAALRGPARASVE